MPTAKKSARAKGVARKSAGRAKKSAKTAKFFEFATCATCRKARSFMKRRGFKLDVRDLQKNRLSATELEKLIGRRDHEDFLNPSLENFSRARHGRPPALPPPSRLLDVQGPGSHPPARRRGWRSRRRRL